MQSTNTNVTPFKKVLGTIRGHPKKTALLIFILSIYAMYKRRKWIIQFTFNQVITRMNQRFMKQMSDQVSNVEKYNSRLSLLQQFSEEFYAQKKYKTFQEQQCFKCQEVEILKTQLKKLNKTQVNYQQLRTELFIKLTQELLVLGISTLHFSRFYELLIYMSQLLFVREKTALYNLMDQDNIVVQNILIKTQAEFCLQLQNIIRQKIMSSEIPNYSNVISYQEFKNFINLFTLDNELKEGNTLIQLVNLEEIQMNARNNIKEAFDILLQPAGQVEVNKALSIAQDKCNDLVTEMLTLNKSPTFLTFYMYSKQFSFTKLWNRFEVLDGRVGNKQEQALFTHLTNLHKICTEEYLNDGAESNNEQFYHKRIKQAFTFVNNNDGQMTQSQFNIVKSAINESIQNKTINQTIRQISRKVFFQDEFQVKEELNGDNEQAGGIGSEISNLLLRLTTDASK